MHSCQSFPLNQDACCYENESVAAISGKKMTRRTNTRLNRKWEELKMRKEKPVQKEYKRHAQRHAKNAKKFKKIPKKCLTALWRSYIIALASRGIRNAETRYTTEAVKLFAGVVQW